MAIPPGQERRFDPAEWRDALVVVERGAVELESAHGIRCRFEEGDVLKLSGLHLRALRNRGDGPAVLKATSRRTRR